MMNQFKSNVSNEEVEEFLNIIKIAR